MLQHIELCTNGTYFRCRVTNYVACRPGLEPNAAAGPAGGGRGRGTRGRLSARKQREDLLAGDGVQLRELHLQSRHARIFRKSRDLSPHLLAPGRVSREPAKARGNGPANAPVN